MDIAPKRERPPEIFLSYAKEDVFQARRIYSGLMSHGFRVWFDEINLLPGQEWELEIEKAIESASIFIACFSKNSVDKDGFYQTELRRALKYFERKPEGSIYLIPIRLDQCDIPYKFRQIQWCDFRSDEWLTDLVKTMRKAGIQP
jgi:hypothetical protein